ncbi:peroxisomal biogenesis factor 11 [Athelia psychrophila]|uniref:Peroxisomal biogenesis factor 11 n=1 Tax=Athelia psychrophila TaxID=1759441 RepID=A0A166AXQ3_9AGAM|nr:peroxisomal biogenesis factor 11 [Fibularhizoctonia sp. CBS 109695]
MASIASQVILHPAATQTLKLWSSTVGRDKTYRTVQNISRLLAWYLINKGHKERAAKWNALKSALGSGRKLMRLGKGLEHLQAALRATQSSGPAGEQITTIGRQLAYAGYLTYDALVWANSVKVLNFTRERKESVGKISNRFWLAGILLNLVHALLKAGRLADEVKALRAPASSEKVGDDAERNAKYHSLQAARAAVRYQFIIDSLDVWAPAHSLGLVNLNDGLLGATGIITSVMALRTQWRAAGARK